MIADFPYGLKVAAWDQASPTEDEIKGLLRGFQFLQGNRELASVVLWSNHFQLGLVQSCLAELNFKHIQVLTWHKNNFNQVTSAPCSMLHTTEVAIVAFHGNPSKAAQYINMPENPLERHDILVGPKLAKKCLDLEEKEINPCEKPAYVAEWILRRLTRPGDNVLVCGFGAGGELKGALNAGCNVLGIELDQRQYHAVKNMMPLFTPKSDLSMVTTAAHMIFGTECMASLGAYRDNKAGGEFDCSICAQSWPGAAKWHCSVCECSFCAGCVAGWEYCKNCSPDVVPNMLPQKPQEKPVEVAEVIAPSVPVVEAAI
jgi:hypothetical protein